MRFLIISPTPTHPVSAGNCMRIVNLIHALQELGHDVHFLHVTYTQGEPDAMRACWGKNFHEYHYRKPWQKYHWHGIPIPDRISRKILNFGWLHQRIDQMYDHGLDDHLLALQEEHSFDAVMVEYVFFSAALNVFPETVHKLIDTHDVYTDRHLMLSQNNMRVEWFFTIESEERKGLKRAHTVLAIQDEENRKLRQILKHSRPVFTVGHFLPPSPQAPPSQLKTLMIIGSGNSLNIRYFQEFIDNCWNPIFSKHPELRLKIVGSVCQNLKRTPGVELLGFVEKIEQTYADSDLVINPLLTGTGLKIKSLEAISYGRALLTTPIGLEGLEDADGKCAMLATTFKEMAQAIEQLLSTPQRLSAMSQAAAEYAGQYQTKQIQALQTALERQPRSA
ncbi:glycosyltransferase [Cerasicoccus maritimus]|uniref:glycosyltransferase n=1 Tax=Cerasicoccus maritimus TaxID=490089 RepID=UPI0028528499|nr:glycosyltransferase [Cerasicoccus maritimus]